MQRLPVITKMHASKLKCKIRGTAAAAFLVMLLIIIAGRLIAADAGSRPLEKVTMALKWKHAFQFAGYYAAIHKGFYHDEGLEVTLTVPENNLFPVEAVVKGKAHYGVSSADLIPSRALGNPIVVLGVIFQHSPIILLSRMDRNLKFLSEYVGRKLMVADGAGGWEEIQAMLLKEGINPKLINVVPHQWSVTPIINGEVDASVDYLIDQPHLMQMQGIEPRVIRPIDYGIDFYADSIFTSEEELKNNPERAEAFFRASIKGWEYALDHVDEMIELIYKMPGVQERGLTKEHLHFEATQMIELIQPKLVEIGHMNPSRWKTMADTYAKLGVIPTNFTIDGFLHFPDQATRQHQRIIKYFSMTIACAAAILLLIVYWNYRLKKEVRFQTEKLDESRRFTIQAVEHSRQLFGWMSPDGLLKYANQTSLEMIGKKYEEVIGNYFWNTPWFSHSLEEQERLRQAIATAAAGKATSYEVVHFTPEGQKHEINLTVHPIFDKAGNVTMLVAEGQDVTHEHIAKRKESVMIEQLHQVQKLEALGQLAGGVAHDFNNSLTGIIGAAELIKSSKEFPPSLNNFVQMILTSAERAGALTKKLLAFSRKGNKASSAVNVATTINDAAAILRSTINKNIAIVVEQKAAYTNVIGDDALLQHCILNLGINASHAMQNGGNITISLENRSLGEEYCQASPFHLRPGEYLEVAVRDNGCGMTPEVQARIFEPFFSTKEPGQGTGLGLSAVYGTILEHQGAVTVYSEPGKGTVFHIYLPVTDQHPGISTNDSEPIPTGNGTVLIIDDEELIRITAEAILTDLGYRIILAENGLEGIKEISRHGDNIDLVILDMIMPVMGGRQTFEKLRELAPSLPVIISSGFSKEEDLAILKDQSIAGFLRKPFRRTELARLVAATLKDMKGFASKPERQG